MTIPRRRVLSLAAAAAALSVAPGVTRAQSWPARPVRIVVGFPAGGSPDLVARILGQWLSERLGQQFIIENRPGAGTNIATEAVVKAPPDGYTLLLASTTNAINAAFYRNLSFNFTRDVEPVAGFVRSPLVMEVTPSLPANSIAELITYARANPGKLNQASTGNGNTSHVAGELFRMMTGVDWVHVPYRGNPMSDLISGQVQIYFAAPGQSIEYVRAGRVRALGVTSTTRIEAMADVPAIAETVPGYEANTWQGIVAPRHTPADIVSRLNGEINAAFTDSKMRDQLARTGNAAFPGSAVEFGRHIADETEKWARVIKFAGIKPD